MEDRIRAEVATELLGLGRLPSLFPREERTRAPLPWVDIELLLCSFHTVLQYVFLLACGRFQLQLQYLQTTLLKVWCHVVDGLIAKQKGFQKLFQQTVEKVGVGYLFTLRLSHRWTIWRMLSVFLDLFYQCLEFRYLRKLLGPWRESIWMCPL